jgi:hypothetical protein
MRGKEKRGAAAMGALYRGDAMGSGGWVTGSATRWRDVGGGGSAAVGRGGVATTLAGGARATSSITGVSAG